VVAGVNTEIAGKIKKLMMLVVGLVVVACLMAECATYP
jgi:hypothetical protein